MRKRIGWRCLFLMLFLFYVSPHATKANAATIRDLLVTNNTQHLLVYERVANSFTKEIEAAIMAGVPTTFTFILELFQERSLWPDKKLIRTEFRHTIKYDNVKQLFWVSKERDEQEISFADFESAKRAMADLNGVPLVPLHVLKKNARYYVQSKVKLDKLRLPFHLEYLFFFVSFWDFETDWRREGFSY